MLRRAAQAGPEPAVLVPYDPIGSTVMKWLHSSAADRPADLEIQCLEQRQGGGGTRYVATVKGVDVFTAQVDRNRSYLFSARILKSIIYRLVTPDDFIKVEFEQGDDPWKGAIVVRFSQSPRWRQTPMTEFVLKKRS